MKRNTCQARDSRNRSLFVHKNVNDLSKSLGVRPKCQLGSTPLGNMTSRARHASKVQTAKRKSRCTYQQQTDVRAILLQQSLLEFMRSQQRCPPARVTLVGAWPSCISRQIDCFGDRQKKTVQKKCTKLIGNLHLNALLSKSPAHWGPENVHFKKKLAQSTGARPQNREGCELP